MSKPYTLCGDASVSVTALTCDSRCAVSGSLFFAVSGTRQNGEDYISDALARGAVCVVCTHAPQEKCTFVLTEDVRIAEAQLAAGFYGESAKRMTVIGITGTNGKTTVSFLLKQLIERCLHAKVGLIGTVQNMIGETVLPAGHTTPDAITLHRLLRRMADEGCTYAVLEVSSHALCQHRVDAIPFALAVFTNLTREHLDYHGTMEEYCAAKARLFSLCRCAAVNGDDPWVTKLLADCTCPVLRYGQDFTDDLVGWRAQYGDASVRFTAVTDGEQAETALGIPGEFSLYNALAALGAALQLGIPLSAAAAALERCSAVRGRAETVPVEAPCTVMIDYAHTPDGLKNILTAVCGFARERVILVFGCGGDRDRGKRERMGSIAAALADLVIVTSDNPRSEDPYAIMHEILAGMRGSLTPFAVLPDRREAIRYALSHAGDGDIVLLAGKGHETVQLIGDRALPFDEREIVREYYKK